MHKYIPVLHVFHGVHHNGRFDASSLLVGNVTFPETEFIAVTAYQVRVASANM